MTPKVPETDIARMLGGNYARFIGMDWSQGETVDQMHRLEDSWRQTRTRRFDERPPHSEFQPNLSRAALVVVDMQNDFVRASAPVEVPEARATIPIIQTLASCFRARHASVIFTRFVAGPQRTLLSNWSPQCAPPTCACWRDTRPDLCRRYRRAVCVRGRRRASGRPEVFLSVTGGECL
jgi:hypothetical protein